MQSEPVLQVTRRTPGRVPHGCWVALLMLGCHTAGSDWMNQPLPGSDDPWAAVPAHPSKRQSRFEQPADSRGRQPAAAFRPAQEQGQVLGTFRNTYYDFPSESDYGGNAVALMDRNCKPIKQVPLEFHDTVCVQGSGILTTGITVSFAKRDCECARTCPRTEQKICFDALSSSDFPWGRGALGQAITPLVTVAVDDSVIPMQEVLYIPEFDGLPRSEAQDSFHDGCFIAQDRGLKVKGQHIDVFTGRRAITELWNRLVPSNQGVTVVRQAPRCETLRRAAR